ncbi:MAG: acyl-CoA dehydrogenase [Deltaproteobacteria bacterium]|nr:acyl-CoA dehydrogenase [Deltaproteobacteria bacterium]
MHLEFTEEQLMIQEMAKNFSKKELCPVAATVDDEERFPFEQVKKLHELGLMGMLVPEAYGGSSSGAVSFALALAEISGGCASTSVTMGVSNMVGEILYRFGNEKQHRKYLPGLCRGDLGLAAFALSEPGAGSDAQAIRTFARKKGNTYRMSGSKVFITNGEHAGVVVAMALTRKNPREITAFIVEPGFEGFNVGKREKKMGLRGSNTVELIFDDMEVPDENVLGGEGNGFKIAMSALDGGRIGIGSQCVGIATAALEGAVKYAEERIQFGVPISDFQAIQWMIADSATEIDAARLLTLRAAFLKDRGVRFSREASMAKLYASEMAYRVCNRAVQIFGGYGYTTDYPAERHLRDVKVTTIYEGTSEVQRMVISRDLLKD